MHAQSCQFFFKLSFSLPTVRWLVHSFAVHTESKSDLVLFFCLSLDGGGDADDDDDRYADGGLKDEQAEVDRLEDEERMDV